MNGNQGKRVWAVPWALALVGLAVPMIGSGFIGWPFVVGWLVVLLLLWWIQPVRGADHLTRMSSGIAAIFGLVLFAFEGGLYLVPSVIAWLILAWRADRQGST